MSTYYNYKFRTNQIVKGGKGQLTKEDVWSLGFDFYKQDNSAVMDLYCFVEEASALRYVPHFMFVESNLLANSIQKSKFQAEEVSLPQGITFISWPKGFKIGKHAANGVMVSNGDLHTRMLWHIYYFNTIDELAPPYSFGDPENSDPQGYFSFTFKSPIDPLQHLKLNIPWESVDKFLAAKDASDMIKVIHGEFFGNPLEMEEMEYQTLLAQAALKTLVYAQAMPGNVKAGVPDKRAMPPKQHHTGVTINAPSSMTGISNPTSVGFHFRQLKHEKYYKNEHKQKAPGSRWVFVEPHERGMKAETIHD